LVGEVVDYVYVVVDEDYGVFYCYLMYEGDGVVDVFDVYVCGRFVE